MNAKRGGAGEREKPPFPILRVIHRISRMERGCRLEQPEGVLRKLRLGWGELVWGLLTSLESTLLVQICSHQRFFLCLEENGFLI